MPRSLVLKAERPRNVNAFQAAAILYGDWGTSKAYVIGLAFALAGYSSFWLIALVGLLNVLVGINYITICKCYPNGGGVYASVRHRSEMLALLGGYALIADYIITAALSALSAFYYLGVPYPEKWALAAILVIGLLNFLGPKHTGNVASFIALPTILVVTLLGAISLFYFEDAYRAIQPLSGSPKTIWNDFVGVVLALSGVESIANSTGVMQLDSTNRRDKPSVSRTSKPAIIVVLFEVVFFTTLLGFAMNALPGLVVVDHTVNAPGHPDVRDYMLRYMGEVFASDLFGSTVGMMFSTLISIGFCGLLLSAVNTAIVALISLLFVMSGDGVLPKKFQYLNQYGVPTIPLILATLLPFTVLASVADIQGLAELYAVGFVGAIATNLGATSTDQYLNLTWRERVFMFATFLIMLSIEITLLIDKPSARFFLFFTLLTGLFLRGLVLEPFPRKRIPPPSYTIASDLETAYTLRHKRGMYGYRAETTPETKLYSLADEMEIKKTEGTFLCAITALGKGLDFAFEEAQKNSQHLYILFIRERKVIINEEMPDNWLDDEDAKKIMDYAHQSSRGSSYTFLYTVSDTPAHNIAKAALELNSVTIVVGLQKYSPLVQIIRGNVLQDIRKLVPSNISVLEVS